MILWETFNKDDSFAVPERNIETALKFVNSQTSIQKNVFGIKYLNPICSSKPEKNFLSEILRQIDIKLKPYCIYNLKFEKSFLKQSEASSSLEFFKSKHENENHIVSATSVQNNLQHVGFVYSYNGHLTNIIKFYIFGRTDTSFLSRKDSSLVHSMEYFLGSMTRTDGIAKKCSSKGLNKSLGMVNICSANRTNSYGNQ